MAGLCEGGNEPPGSLKARKQGGGECEERRKECEGKGEGGDEGAQKAKEAKKVKKEAKKVKKLTKIGKEETKKEARKIEERGADAVKRWFRTEAADFYDTKIDPMV
ncbi:hypothetical protein ANN_04206 [Periplaneta americana]|uniref:Uncharacterized protein n=1 Tax=Periplaneta americana TaxID=6978 RepID=A0ABQ8T7X8_PERAM|nr:hypothetical protein ANN_04206 [Periplaneta americana]